MPLVRSLYTPEIICGKVWPLLVQTLLIQVSSKNSNINPFTVSKSSGPNVIFAHSCSFVDIKPLSKFWIFCYDHYFSSERNCLNSFTLCKNILSCSWIGYSSVLMSWGFYFSFDSLKKSLYWKNNWRKLLRCPGTYNLSVWRSQ